MGKRIIQQARGKGSLTYRVKKRAFSIKISFPRRENVGEATILKIVHSPAHSAPLMKLSLNNEIFHVPAFNLANEGQKIQVGKAEPNIGNILALKEIPAGTQIYNVERN